MCDEGSIPHEGRLQKLKTELNKLSSLQHENLVCSSICCLLGGGLLGLISQAAKEGNPVARVLHNLAWSYCMGDCVSKDGRKAVELYEKAIGAGSVPAMFNLGMMYELGDGVEEDMKKAVYHYASASLYGDSDAQMSLGLMYEDGKVVPPRFTHGRWCCINRVQLRVTNPQFISLKTSNSMPFFPLHNENLTIINNTNRTEFYARNS